MQRHSERSTSQLISANLIHVAHGVFVAVVWLLLLVAAIYRGIWTSIDYAINGRLSLHLSVRFFIYHFDLAVILYFAGTFAAFSVKMRLTPVTLLISASICASSQLRLRLRSYLSFIHMISVLMRSIQFELERTLLVLLLLFQWSVLSRPFLYASSLLFSCNFLLECNDSTVFPATEAAFTFVVVCFHCNCCWRPRSGVHNARNLWQHIFIVIVVLCTSRFLCFCCVAAVVAIGFQQKIFPDSHLCDRRAPQCVQWLFASTIDLLLFLLQHARRNGTSTHKYILTNICMYVYVCVWLHARA